MTRQKNKNHNFRKDFHAGDFVTVNDSVIKGHKGRVSKKRQSGIVEIVVVTHAPRTNSKKNIRLKENPQPGDERVSYVIRKKRTTKENKIGKKHPNMKVTNKQDKAVFRKIGNQK